MQTVFEFILAPYNNYSFNQILLEIIASIFGILSVLFSKNRNILVYPTGIISTLIFIYLFFSWGLYGETLINFYYTGMSIYGWIIWSKNHNQRQVIVSWAKKKDYLVALNWFILTVIFILILYHFRPIINQKTPLFLAHTISWNYNTIDFIDAFITGIFLVGMWMMAKRKIDNWIFWIIGDFFMIPLLIYKGYAISAFQYLIFTILAILGFFEWKKSLIEKKNIT